MITNCLGSLILLSKFNRFPSMVLINTFLWYGFRYKQLKDNFLNELNNKQVTTQIYLSKKLGRMLQRIVQSTLRDEMTLAQG